jgi:AraC-like DNA-binding protein
MGGVPARAAFLVDSPGPAEQSVSFQVGDSWCRSRTIDLPAGVRLGVTRCQFESSFSFSAEQPPAELELVVSKGSVLRASTEAGLEFQRGGNTLQLGQTRSPLRLQMRPTDEAQMECVSISLSARRLRELLGVSELPPAFRAVTDSRAPHPLVSQAMTPGLLRLLDEIANADVKGAGRRLWHQAKSLELIALMTDELDDTVRASAPLLSTHDIDCLERVRRCLVERLEEPPTLAELARMAGFSQTKLKGGFRARFGTSVFAYLRQARLEEARRLLFARQLNVTEAALRVGYANPSKFAAAFRRQFGLRPSEL